ncbi:hypothetical protein Rai3103_04560 [Raineyella fluvialis]|uniref:Uncharacterized protein n=1 Tax=Raineyella fluvialis TaxID=2662261 RepID=A0A5Q2FF90_9ACTN|nr:hypothetical protein Rai3103_04560 [Raineyella fluvialis]
MTVPSASIRSVLRGWPPSRWAAAAGGAVGTILVVGLPTVLIPNSVFARAVPVTWWAWPTLIVTAVLAGLVGATYVRRGSTSAEAPSASHGSKAGMAGGLLSYFAVGCPVCNKIALLALGYSGALRWFAPAQPFLALLGIGLLAYALHRRLRGDMACVSR